MVGFPGPRLPNDMDLPGSPLGELSVRCDYLVFAGNEESAFKSAPVEVRRSGERR